MTMRSTSFAILALCAALALGGGCADDDQSGIPQPFPLPKPDRDLLRSTAVPPDAAASEIRIVGLPGAVSRAGEVIATLGSAEVRARSSARGSFTLLIAARAGDSIALRFETSEPLALEVPVLGVMAPRPPHELAGVPPLSGPAAGVVTIRGETSPSTAVLAIDAQNGEAGTARSDATGRFELQLQAASGDELLVYDDHDPLQAAWSLRVP